jgi:FkbM family methyltransferase
MSIEEKLQTTLDSMLESMELTDSRVGQFLIYKNDNTISKAIRLFGEYCHAEVEIMKTYLSDNSMYVDIGTNIGYHLVAVQKETGCNAIGFEPNPKHFAVASYNSKDCSQIQLVNAAASDHKFNFKMKDFDPSNSGNYGDIHKDDTGAVEVQAIPLDSLNLERCSFIKIDVEGHELEALTGCSKTISKYRPVIMYEAMEWDVWTKCYEFLDERKYKMYWVACRTKPIAKTFKETEENPFGFSTVSNILCVPEERDQPDYLVEVTNYEPFSSKFEKLKKLKVLF